MNGIYFLVEANNFRGEDHTRSRGDPMKSPTDGRRFRLNVVFKKSITYQSMPALLNESDMRELIEILEEALAQ